LKKEEDKEGGGAAEEEIGRGEGTAALAEEGTREGIFETLASCSIPESERGGRRISKGEALTGKVPGWGQGAAL